MKHTYYANFCANDNTYNREPYEYANKREAIKDIRYRAKANTFAGSRAWVSVTDETGEEVYHAWIRN